MITVGSHEARMHFGALLNKVATGERVTITRRGVPVAVLNPVDEPGKKDIAQVIERILENRKGKTTGGMSIREMIEEGRR